MWPIIKSRQNVIAIGSMFGSNAKKSLEGRQGGYLFPVINDLVRSQERPSDAPLAIILCPRWKAVKYLTELCEEVSEGKHTVLSFYRPFGITIYQNLHSCPMLSCVWLV